MASLDVRGGDGYEIERSNRPETGRRQPADQSERMMLKTPTDEGTIESKEERERFVAFPGKSRERGRWPIPLRSIRLDDKPWPPILNRLAIAAVIKSTKAGLPNSIGTIASGVSSLGTRCRIFTRAIKQVVFRFFPPPIVLRRQNSKVCR